jgi:plasmid maintenance system antidote protein VapI
MMVNFLTNRISILLKEREIQGFSFNPSRSFYEKIGIRQKRWGQLIRNEKPATTEELYKVAEYFNFNKDEIIEFQTTSNA